MPKAAPRSLGSMLALMDQAFIQPPASCGLQVVARSRLRAYSFNSSARATVRPRSLAVLLHGQVRRRRAFENLVHVYGGALVQIEKARAKIPARGQFG
jgi:hypothetical protein